MIYLSIRTDKPESEISIFDNTTSLSKYVWVANRQLAETIHSKIEEQLNKQNIEYGDIKGILFYKGPGSFTGLRIGASVANALAFSLNVPIVGTADEGWEQKAIKMLQDGKNNRIIVPEYGALPNITAQKK